MCNYKKSVNENPFQELLEFTLEVVILPQSHAEVERLFSTMNLVKSKLRNLMQLPMLTAILSIKRYNQYCSTFQLPVDIVKKNQNERYVLQHSKCG